MGEEAPKLEDAVGDLEVLLLLCLERVLGELGQIGQLRGLAFSGQDNLAAVLHQQVRGINGRALLRLIAIRRLTVKRSINVPT